jgi:GNAT superfamily N-acetyltransferase
MGELPAVIGDIEVDGVRHRITRARREDVPRLVELLRDDMLGREREVDDLAPYYAAYDAIRRDPAHLLVAVLDDDDTVVATCQLTLLPGLARAGAVRLQIEGLRVARPARGGGIGGAFMDWVVGHARRQGASLVQLTTDRERMDARGFYERAGFVASHIGMKLDLTDDAH